MAQIPVWFPDLVPKPQWLLNSVLYEDGLAAITPQDSSGTEHPSHSGEGHLKTQAKALRRRLSDREWDEMALVLDDLEHLKSEGLFRPLPVGALIGDSAPDVNGLIEYLDERDFPTVYVHCGIQPYDRFRPGETDAQFAERVAEWTKGEQAHKAAEQAKLDDARSAPDYEVKKAQYEGWKQLQASYTERVAQLKVRVAELFADAPPETVRAQRRALNAELAQARAELQQLATVSRVPNPDPQDFPYSKRPVRVRDWHAPQPDWEECGLSPILPGKVGANAASALCEKEYLRKVDYQLLEGTPSTVDAIVEWLANWAAVKDGSLIPTRLLASEGSDPIIGPAGVPPTMPIGLRTVLPTLHGVSIKEALSFRKDHDKQLSAFRKLLQKIGEDPKSVNGLVREIESLLEEIDAKCNETFRQRVASGSRKVLWDTGAAQTIGVDVLAGALHLGPANPAALTLSLVVGTASAHPWTWRTKRQLRYVAAVQREAHRTQEHRSPR